MSVLCVNMSFSRGRSATDTMKLFVDGCSCNNYTLNSTMPAACCRSVTCIHMCSGELQRDSGQSVCGAEKSQWK